MRTTLIFLLLTTRLFTACSQSEARVGELFSQIATQDSGYLQKKDALLILSMANVLDSTNIDYERDIKESDTIAKYYRMNNGNYLFSIEYDIYYAPILIECSPKGKVLKKEDYFHGYSGHCRNFYKLGDFFGLEIYDQGFPSANILLYLFKEVTPQDSLNIIPIWHWDIYNEEEDEEGHAINITYIDCSSTMKLENDSLTVTYITEILVMEPVDNEKDDKVVFKVIEEKEPLDVLYIYKNKQWHLADKENLETLPYWISFHWE